MMPHDLLDAEQARSLLKMPRQKFDLLVESGRLKPFRGDGKSCFRREDLTDIARNRQSQQCDATVAPKILGTNRKPGFASSRISSANEEASENPLGHGDSETRDAIVSITSRSSGRRAVLRSLLAVALLAIGLCTYLWTRTHSEASAATDERLPVSSPGETPFPNCVAAPGLVESSVGLRNLSFDIPGKISTVTVEEGQLVKAGQLIAELQNDDAMARLDSARADFAAAEARLKMTTCNLGAGIVRAQKEVERLAAELAILEAGPRKETVRAAFADAAAAEADAVRMKEDAQKYFDPSGKFESWSKQLYDQARRNAEAAAARWQAAQARLQELEAGSRPEDIAKSRAIFGSAQTELARLQATQPFEIDSVRSQLAQARAQVANADAALNKTRLISPINGTIIWKFMHGGEAIDSIQRQPVVAVADLSCLRVRASVNEADYPHIAKGQRVRITADAFGEKFFTGHVERVGNSAGEKPFDTGEAKEHLDVHVIETIVTLDTPAPLKLGLRVTAWFEEK